MSRPDREEMGRMPIETQKYSGKRYLTLNSIDQIIALFGEEEIREEMYKQLREVEDGLVKRTRKDEQERIVAVIEDLNSIGFPYGADFKRAILQTLKEKT